MKAVVSKERVFLKTYPYSDPSPLPEFGRIYPYNRFDGYTWDGEDESWEMVVLENRYIKVWINPAVGGKVWGAIEKSSGKEFIYFNHAAKFRDVAMRGPWTSGGIEFNVGILGHSLSCSTPVDCVTREHADGSVSCMIGAMDWPSRTRWTVEISLGGEAAWFKTRTFWWNGSGQEQPCYSWSNAGVKTKGDLEYIFPGDRYLGHDGRAHSWPLDAKGRNLSLYERNDFGHYKSYHVTGSGSDFWGCYWRKDQFGMAHYSPYDQKPGKKIWIWGLSRYGMIWEDLLTDADGQYTEVQSGRLLNQSISSSSATPFKHRSFMPGAYDVWEEYWMPVKGVGGLSYGCPAMSFYFDGALHICANEVLNRMLRVEDKDGELATERLKLDCMEVRDVVFGRPADGGSLRLWLDEEPVYDAGAESTSLKRPTKIVEGFHYDSVEALYLQGKEWERQRFYARAIEKYTECLGKDGSHLRALTAMAGLRLRLMDDSAALGGLMQSMAIDSYDGESNYLYGLVNMRQGNREDAKDGFSIAGQSPAYRSAAMLELSKMAIVQRGYTKALGYLEEALVSNGRSVQAWQQRVYVLRMRGEDVLARVLAAERLQEDPLDHLLSFELYRLGMDVPGGWDAGIRSEWPHETYLELAAFYWAVEAWEEVVELLSFAPVHTMVELWKAYAYYRMGQEQLVLSVLENAMALDCGQVFPHRYEDMAVLRWAAERTGSWKARYYMALLLIQVLKEAEGLALLEACGEAPDYYPFYLLRASVGVWPETDLLRAAALAPGAWRPVLQLSRYYAAQEQWAAALSVAEKGYAAAPGNYYLGLQLAKAYMYNERYEEGIALMRGLDVLPNEGASEGRNVWRETNLFAGIGAMEAGRYDVALRYVAAARSWPEHIGVGRPYEVDERVEDVMEYLCVRGAGSSGEVGAVAGEVVARVAGFRDRYPDLPAGSAELLTILFLEPLAVADYREKWLPAASGALPVRWCNALLDGDEALLAALTAEKLVPPVVLPYEVPFEDRDFLLIRKLFGTGLLKPDLTSNKNVKI